MIDSILSASGLSPNGMNNPSGQFLFPGCIDAVRQREALDAERGRKGHTHPFPPATQMVNETGAGEDLVADVVAS